MIYNCFNPCNENMNTANLKTFCGCDMYHLNKVSLVILLCTGLQEFVSRGQPGEE